MPPKGVVVASPSPPPMPPNDVQDLLVIADMVDTLDHVPAEVTRVHSDLNELSAVLYSTLVTLENKLNTLVTWIQDDSVSPADRFQLLQEIAEEAARYKLGGDDKIRVSAGACDGLMHHQKHISNLLQSSTLLASAPPSPYTQALTLANPQPLTNTRRGVLARAANSPFGGRGYAAASGSGETVKDKDTPSKKKKSRVAQLGVKDDDEVSIAGKKPTKKRKPTNRAVSPTDSLASASAFTGKPIEPRTARQLAAAANRAARKIEDYADSDDDADSDGGNAPPDDKNGLELALGETSGHSRESTSGGKAHAAPAAGNAKGNGRGGRAGGSNKRPLDPDGFSLESSDEDTKNWKAPPKKVPKGTVATNQHIAPDGDGDADMDQDASPYCICHGPSYGEMIGCDNDNCDIEWFHISCLGLSRPPEGEWTCPQCTEKLGKHPSKKRASRAKARK